MSQTILLTGATGFLGNHLLRGLLDNNYQVIALKRSFSNTVRIDDILDRITCYDIDQCKLEQPFRDFAKIDAVIHTATAYGRKQESLTEIFAANTFFPLQLLQVAIDFKTDIFINTDTSAAKSLNFYVLAKKQFKEWGERLADLEKIRFVNIILEIMFGPNDDTYKFHNYVIEQCLKNVPQIETTPGDQKRDFIYIKDVISAYLLILDKAFQQQKFSQEYELGSGNAISMREYLEIVKELTNSQTEFKFGAKPYRDHEVMFSEANLAALQQLGWSPQYTIKEGLEETIKAFLP
jgi:CDP-paratose synthetase